MTQAIERRAFERIQPLTIVRQLISNWRKRRRLYDLQHLDDHILKDIGLDRSDVQAVLGQPVTVDPVVDLEHRVRVRRARSMPDATARWLRDRAYAHPRFDARR